MKEIFLEVPGPSFSTREELTECKEQSRKTKRNHSTALQAITKYTLETPRIGAAGWRESLQKGTKPEGLKGKEKPPMTENAES